MLTYIIINKLLNTEKDNIEFNVLCNKKIKKNNVFNGPRYVSD